MKIKSFAAMILLSTAFLLPALAETTGGTISIKTKGLVCDFCARALEKKFSKREEVEKFSIDLTTKILTLDLKEGKSIDDATLEKVIAESGYNIESIERS